MHELDLALILFFALIFLGILTLQLFYVLFFRRRFRRNTFGDPELAVVDNGRETFRSSSCCKDPIGYLLCYKRQSQVKPTGCDGATEADKAGEKQPSTTENGEEDQEGEYDLEKLQDMRQGGSRFLYTIKEDERGETASSISDRSEKESEVTYPPPPPPLPPAATTPLYTVYTDVFATPQNRGPASATDFME